MEQHMKEHIEQHTGFTADLLKDEIATAAEKYAEIYVSSDLSIEDPDQKQSVKNIYIEEFCEVVKKKML